MDSAAYLKKQGWRGKGHSLDHTDRGIKNPLLVSKKVDVLGVGINKHAAVSDQWWLRAYDAGLKDFGTGKESTLSTVKSQGVNRGGLYGRFVRGEGVQGTIDEPKSPKKATEQALPKKRSEDIAKMPTVDNVPVDKLERVIDPNADPTQQAALMHLLQNPSEAPVGMQKMLDKKRKRAERPVEKRARRKIERFEKEKSNAQKKKEEAIANGTFDAAAEAKRSMEEDLNKRVNQFVAEVQKRGVIPSGPNDIRKGMFPSGANATTLDGQASNGLLDQLNAIVNDATSNKKLSEKGQKFAREKAKRELKRIAKAYLSGEKTADQMNREEELRERKLQKRMQRREKNAEVEAKRAEVANAKFERRQNKKAEKAMKEAERQETAKRLSEQDGVSLPQATSGDDFGSGADEIRLGINTAGKPKKIPGVGAVSRYPSKVEKRQKKLRATALENGTTVDVVLAEEATKEAAKKAAEREKVDAYRAAKHGLSLAEYRDKLALGELVPPKDQDIEEKKRLLPAEKLAQYEERATEKSISVNEYIRRREIKYAAKQAEKLPNPYQKDLAEAAKGGADFIAPDNPNVAHADENADGLGFVVDTAGDDALATGKKDGRPLAMVDTTGDKTLATAKNLPVPLDPSLWADKKVKDLPKAVRRARKEFMAQKREAKKAKKNAKNTSGIAKKSKGQRKVEAREAFVKEILYESRKMQRTRGGNGGSYGMGAGMITVQGVENVPVVKLESTEGMFKKGEISLARTVARRVLRNVKRDMKAAKGKGKGYKKRERSEKEAARNAGISGFTDKARIDPARAALVPDLLK